MEPHRRRDIALSLIGWVAVWCFWLVVTRTYHPARGLALVVTTSLVTAYALASFANHLWLIPRWRARPSSVRYWFELIATMLLLTGIALAVLRARYIAAIGPDPDPYGV